MLLKIFALAVTVALAIALACGTILLVVFTKGLVKEIKKDFNIDEYEKESAK